MAFWEFTPETTTHVAREVSFSKPVTKALLARAGIQVPAGKVFERGGLGAGWGFAKGIGFPIVVKPTIVTGAGVTANIMTEDHFRLAWESALEASAKARVMVEKHVQGKDFRLFVIGDQVVAAARRVPAYVEGDGRSSIVELVAEKNEGRQVNPYLGAMAMKLTPMVIRNLGEMGLGPEAVLEQGRRVTPAPIQNLGAGGESLDVTALVHPDFEDIAVSARKALPGALHAGVDLLADDVSAPAVAQEWAVCEVNTFPDVALHHFPVSGRPRDAAGALIEYLFPGSRRCEPFEWQSIRTVISGQVTGVGFRRWIRRRAMLRGLTGSVRNRGGSVEAVFSGAPQAIDDMVELCRSGPRKAVVTDLAVEPWGEAAAADFQVLS